MCLQKPLLRPEHRWEKPIAANMKLKASSAVGTERSSQGQAHYLLLKFLQTLLFRCNEPCLDPVCKDREALNFWVWRLQLHTWVSEPWIWRLGILDVDFPQGLGELIPVIVKMYCAEGWETLTRSVSLPGQGFPPPGLGVPLLCSLSTSCTRRERKCILSAMQKMGIKAVSGIQFSNMTHCVFFLSKQEMIVAEKYTHSFPWHEGRLYRSSLNTDSCGK